MQKRKFDELISHFNRKVSDMSIDQKYKMELLGMISAIGFAHEKELGTNLAEVGTDCISRQTAIDFIDAGHLVNPNEPRWSDNEVVNFLKSRPSAQPEINCSEFPNSSDTISRAKAIDALDKRFDSIPMEQTSEILMLRKDLRELPPVEPQIIRCKDCKYWIPYDWMFSEVWQSKNIADYPEDEIGCDCCDMAMKANDFCSRGERRTDE